MKNRIDTSKQKTLWNNISNVSITQEFIADVYKKNYQTKHPEIWKINEDKNETPRSLLWGVSFDWIREIYINK